MAWCLLTFNLCQWPEYVKKETSYRLRKKHTSILFSFIRGTMHKNINPIREKMLCTRFSYKPIYIQGFWAVTQNMALITWCWMMKGLAWVTDEKQDLWFRWALDKFMDVQHKIHSWITHHTWISKASVTLVLRPVSKPKATIWGLFPNWLPVDWW